jgi:hypothetical protein
MKTERQRASRSDIRIAVSRCRDNMTVEEWIELVRDTIPRVTDGSVIDPRDAA